jgi:MFS family permease
VPTVVTTRFVDRTQLAAARSPQAQPNHERAIGDDRFEATTGPFDRYERTVEHHELSDGRIELTETVDFKLALPVWAPLFNPLVKRQISHPSPNPDAPQPWWSPPDVLDARAARSISLLCVFSMVAGYLQSLLSQTNTYFKADFGASSTDISFVLTAARLGGLLALVIMVFADREGRKRILLLATYLGIAATAIGAFAPNLFVLTASQTVGRACGASIAFIIVIMAAEEMPSGSRAFAVSVLTVTAALGVGGVVLFLGIADISVGAWRIFFIAPVLFILPIRRLARRLPETRRFEVLEAEQELPGEYARPTAGNRSRTVRRFLVLALSTFLFNIFLAPAGAYQNDFLHTELGFDGLALTLFIVLTNVPPGVSIIVGGRLADRFGRRVVGAVGTAGGTAFTVLMFTSTGWLVWIWSAIATVFGAAAVPALGVYGPELFPTGSRGKAGGGLTVLSVGGSVIGLVAAGALHDHFGKWGTPIMILAIAPVFVVLIVLFLYPETAHKSLEDLNPEDVAPPSTLAGIADLEDELDQVHGTEHDPLAD